MLCDICNSPATGQTVKAPSMSAAVKAGFNPYKARLAPDMMEAAGLGSSYAEWRESAIHGVLSRTDWNVCDTCMAHLKGYLGQSRIPRVAKSSTRSANPKTDPSALLMQAVSQGRRSRYTSTSFVVKSFLIITGVVGTGVVLAATLAFSTRNTDLPGAPSKNERPSTIRNGQAVFSAVPDRTAKSEPSASTQPSASILSLKDVYEHMRTKKLKDRYGCQITKWRMRPNSTITKYVELVKDEGGQFRLVETLLCEGQNGLLFALEDKPRKPLEESENSYAVFSRGSFEGTLASVKTFGGTDAPVLKDWTVHFGEDSSSQRRP